MGEIPVFPVKEIFAKKTGTNNWRNLWRSSRNHKDNCVRNREGYDKNSTKILWEIPLKIHKKSPKSPRRSFGRKPEPGLEQINWFGVIFSRTDLTYFIRSKAVI